MGQRVRIAEVLQIQLLIALFQTVGNKKLDRRKQRGILFMPTRIVQPQKSDDLFSPAERHRQQPPHMLLPKHLVACKILFLLQIVHVVHIFLPEMLHPVRDDLHRHLLQVVELGHDARLHRLVGIDQKRFPPDLEQVAAVCLKIIPHNFHQPPQGNVPIDPYRKLCHAPVEHRGDLQLFRDLRPAGLQLLQPGILLPDRHQKHQEHRNTDHQVDHGRVAKQELDHRTCQRGNDVGTDGQKQPPADLMPVPPQQACLGQHDAHWDQHTDREARRTVVNVFGVKTVVQPGKLRQNDQCHPQKAACFCHFDAFQGMLLSDGEQAAVDVSLKEKQCHIQQKIDQKVRDPHHPISRSSRYSIKETGIRITEQQQCRRDLHPDHPFSRPRLIVFSPEITGRRHLTKKAFAQQQRTVDSL